MEYILLILILFIMINTAVKLSFWKLWQITLWSVLLALFVIFAYPFATELSKTGLSDMVRKPDVMQNIAVIITLECVVFFAFSFIALKQVFGKQVKARLALPLHFYPGLLVFPVIFFVLGQLIFSFPGVRFSTLAYLTAASIIILMPLLVWGVKRMLPETDFRLELLFITTFFTGLTGLITTVNGNTLYKAVTRPLDIKALLFTMLGFAALFAAGYIFNKYRKFKI